MNPNQPIIDSGRRFVLSVAGGGQEVLGQLTRYGGMSGCLLEGIVPYSMVATNALLGGVPDKYVSSETARALAMACYQRALRYVPDDVGKLFAVGSTGSVVKPGGERTGREHLLFIGIQDYDRTMTVSISLKPGFRTREEEENTASALINTAVRWGANLFGDMSNYLVEGQDVYQVYSTIAQSEWVELLHGQRDLWSSVQLPARGIFCSSCNPLHDGHVAILKSAHNRLGEAVDVELCVHNADKPSLDYTAIAGRLAQTNVKLTESCLQGTGIHLTSKPYFFDKAELFPGRVFVVGSDTFRRINDPTYYRGNGLEQGAKRFVESGCSFLVYPRKGDYCGISSLHPRIGDVTTVITNAEFEPSDISSTALRRKREPPV